MNEAPFAIALRVTATFVSRQKHRGTVAVSVLLMAGIALLPLFFVFFEKVPEASADDVSTSVTVLNTAPAWTVNAQESTESSTTTPTNSGQVITWVATGTDSSGDNYYLLICKTSATPTANPNQVPSCGGGISNRLAVSASTVSGAQASAATTTLETFPFNNESNEWYAWICDGNGTLPRCNITATQGSGTTNSPFVVNHPPVFALVSNDTPLNPGETITWTTTAYDNDTLETNDTVRLLVCKTNDYANGACGGGGTWATSTLTSSNPATTTTIAIPRQDGTYAAYVYVIDNHNHQATSTNQGSNSFFVVNNVTPTISAATVSLEDIDSVGNLTLVTPSATSGAFKVRFTVVDDNSCQNGGASNEIASARANIYRSGIGQASCDESGEYNANSCYVNQSPYFSSHISCVQDGGSCSGATDSDSTWTCSFNLWYNADPTDASTPWTAENWRTSVEASDDNYATSTLVEGTTGNELVSFLAFDVSSTSIPYGSFEPGSQSAILATSTDLRAVGNVGLDEDLYGDTMCTTWSAPDSCDTNGYQAGNDILIANQKVATTTVTYTDAEAYTMSGSTTPREMLVRVPKTTATSSPNVRYTFWGIAVPIAITTSGNYTGQNTITAKKSNSAFW